MRVLSILIRDGVALAVDAGLIVFGVEGFGGTLFGIVIELTLVRRRAFANALLLMIFLIVFEVLGGEITALVLEMIILIFEIIGMFSEAVSEMDMGSFSGDYGMFIFGSAITVVSFTESNLRTGRVPDGCLPFFMGSHWKSH